MDLSSAKKLCIDTNIFIFSLQHHPTFGLASKNVFDDAQTRGQAIITSVLTLSEILVFPQKKHDAKQVRRYSDFFSSAKGIRLIDVDVQVAREASAIRACYGLRLPDSLQLATAVVEKANIFLTNDKKLKQVKEVPVILLSDLF